MRFDPFPNIQGAFLGRASLPKEKLWAERSIQVKQVHGDRWLWIENAEQKETLRDTEADALFTTLKDCPLAVRTADCVPILVAHPQGLVGVVHAGWRGTLATILQKSLIDIGNKSAVDWAKAQFAIGPSICGNCYEVGEDVADLFSQEGKDQFLASRGPGKYLLDLHRANLQQLLDLGIPRSQISLQTTCTLENSGVFFSYRKAVATSQPNAGRNISLIEFSPDRRP